MTLVTMWNGLSNVLPTKDESISIMGSRKANEIGDGTCIYSNGKDAFTLRPHIYRGVPCNGWTIDDNGNIVQRG